MLTGSTHPFLIVYVMVCVCDDMQDKKCVIQRYVADPFLIDGRKFDLRLYVLVSTMTYISKCRYIYIWSTIYVCNYPFRLMPGSRQQDVMAYPPSHTLYLPLLVSSVGTV